MEFQRHAVRAAEPELALSGYYDKMFGLLIGFALNAFGVVFDIARNTKDPSTFSSSSDNQGEKWIQRPDFMLTVNSLLVVLGEEKVEGKLDKAVHQCTDR